MADCCICCCKTRPMQLVSLSRPPQSEFPPLYVAITTNSPVFTLLQPRLRGSKEKSITVTSGAGSWVNQDLDEWGRQKKKKMWKKCLSVCVSVLSKGSSKEMAWLKASWVQVSGLSGIKFMTIDRNRAHVCVCLCVRWFFVWILVESDRGEESSYKAHYG